ncbi:MAG: hypothetical protein ACYC1E_11745 [Propionibacteriaceae bacterium]
MAFAACLRREGVNALDADVAPAQAVVDELSARRPPVTVRVGGRNRHLIRGTRQLEDPAGLLPHMILTLVIGMLADRLFSTWPQGLRRAGGLAADR